MDWDELIAQACRHFGGDPDYWEDALTMRRLAAQAKNLKKNPPPESFLAAYFVGQGWWRPQRMDAPDVLEELPESDLPEFEP